MRRGVECALRSRAAVDVEFRAGFEGWWANRSGRGVFVDLMPRIDVYAVLGRAICVALCWMRERAEKGRRKDGGRRPQPRDALGGIVDIAACVMGRSSTKLRLEVFEHGAQTRTRDGAFIKYFESSLVIFKGGKLDCTLFRLPRLEPKYIVLFTRSTFLYDSDHIQLANLNM